MIAAVFATDLVTFDALLAPHFESTSTSTSTSTASDMRDNQTGLDQWLADHKARFLRDVQDGNSDRWTVVMGNEAGGELRRRRSHPSRAPPDAVDLRSPGQISTLSRRRSRSPTLRRSRPLPLPTSLSN